VINLTSINKQDIIANTFIKVAKIWILDIFCSDDLFTGTFTMVSYKENF
jgi:hypothetical protein